jgi:hypothetical protein
LSAECVAYLIPVTRDSGSSSVLDSINYVYLKKRQRCRGTKY